MAFIIQLKGAQNIRSGFGTSLIMLVFDQEEYDYILIDCIPSLGMLTINVLTAARSVLIPVQAFFPVSLRYKSLRTYAPLL